MIIKRGVPVFVAIFFGLLTLVGLIIPLPQINQIVLNWAAFLAAIALLLGVLNLLGVHTRRLFRERNLYSAVLVISMLGVFTLAVTDSPQVGLTKNGFETYFNWVQAPLEAALASLLAFLLLVTGFQMLQRQRNGWAFLFC